MAADAVGLDALVRTGQIEEILRVLDLGATGILAPHISTPEEARALVSAVRYPPEGERGFASYTRAASYGLLSGSAHHEMMQRSLVTIAMIEDELGVENASAIAATEGIDGVLVGPADLACSMGRVGSTDDPAVSRSLARVADSVSGAGAALMTIVSNRSAAEQAFSRGSAMVVYNLQAGISALFQELASADKAPSWEKPTVVFLPGMLEDASLWDGVVDALDGAAIPIHGRIDLDASVTEMAESVLVTAPERFTLVGHSLGGIVALEVARRAPQRVSGLGLINSSAREPTAAQLKAWSDLRTRVETGQFEGLVHEQALLNAGPKAPASVVESATRMGQAIGAPALLRQLSAQSTREDMRPVLSSLEMPILVVSGALDAICPLERQTEIASLSPNAAQVTIQGVGHLTPLECPGQLAARFTEWLEGQYAGGPTAIQK